MIRLAMMDRRWMGLVGLYGSRKCAQLIGQSKINAMHTTQTFSVSCYIIPHPLTSISDNVLFLEE